MRCMGPVNTFKCSLQAEFLLCSVFIFIVGKGLGPVHKSTGPVEILTRVQFLYTCNDFNGSNAPVHWTQAAPFIVCTTLYQ